MDPSINMIRIEPIFDLLTIYWQLTFSLSNAITNKWAKCTTYSSMKIWINIFQNATPFSSTIDDVIVFNFPDRIIPREHSEWCLLMTCIEKVPHLITSSRKDGWLLKALEDTQFPMVNNYSFKSWSFKINANSIDGICEIEEKYSLPRDCNESFNKSHKLN